jgi:hypothetical protein
MIPDLHDEERALFAAIHAAKAERMRATRAGDLERAADLQVEIGRLTAEVWRVRMDAAKLGVQEEIGYNG